MKLKEKFTTTIDRADGNEPLRRSEIRETGQFTAVAATGFSYRIVQLTRVVSVTFRNEPELSTEGDTWYQTRAGKLVRPLGSEGFEIVASKVRLQRIHAEVLAPPAAGASISGAG